MSERVIRLEAMTSDAASAIAEWRYEPPYDFYDLDADPDDLAEFLDPARWGTSAFAAFDGDALIGWFIFDRAERDVVIGLGLRPDLTGSGLGATFVHAGLEFARRRFAPERFVLSVAAFNARARRLYANLGFTETRAFDQATNGGTWEFVEMVLPD